MSKARAVLVKEIQATPERVFDTCTKVELLALWLGPTALVATHVEADATVGGRFLFRLHGAGGTYAAAGRYVELIPARRIVMTWAWVEAPDLPSGSEPGLPSLVTFDIAPAPHGSTLTLTHEDLPDDQTADDHLHGWGEAIDKLASLLRAAD